MNNNIFEDTSSIIFIILVHRWRDEDLLGVFRVPNSPTGQVLEAGPGWLVLVMAMTGLD